MQDLEKICKTWENARLHKMQAGENRQMGKYARLEKGYRWGGKSWAGAGQLRPRHANEVWKVGCAPWNVVGAQENVVRGTQMRSGKSSATAATFVRGTPMRSGKLAEIGKDRQMGKYARLGNMQDRGKYAI